jgi:drug/metabolite transporter (DMT)-like permease
MLALGFGLTAALAWAVHDLLARKLSQGAALLPLLFIVLGAGSLALLPATVALGDWSAMRPRAYWAAGLGGVAFAIAIGGLYKAFSLAPVRLVSPIIGAYPMLTLAIAATQGRTITGMEWLAVVAVVLGIAIVALTSRTEADQTPGATLPAILWSIISACGFAATFALGQEAARQGSDFPAILVMRLVALLVIVMLFAIWRTPFVAMRGQWGTLFLMGVIDAGALSLVLAAGGLPQPEYASVSAALFGVLTILLAARFLGEQVRAVQWLGIAVVFAGIGVLSAQV